MSLELVEQIKADLVARGISLDGACGAFQITKRVAWALRAQGIGILWKGSGFNCEGFSCDCVILPTGVHFDVLKDGGNENKPIWNQVNHEGTENPYLRPESYRPAIDPGDGGAASPVPAPVEGTPPSPRPPTPVPAPPIVIADPRTGARLDALEQADRDQAGTAEAISQRTTALEGAELVADGNTGRVFGHGHPATLPVRPMTEDEKKRRDP